MDEDFVLPNFVMYYVSPFIDGYDGCWSCEKKSCQTCQDRDQWKRDIQIALKMYPEE